MNNKVFNDLIYHEKSISYALCPLPRCPILPLLHQACFSIIGPFYMNIYWMYRRMTKYKNIFGNINKTVSKCFLNNDSLFF